MKVVPFDRSFFTLATARSVVTQTVRELCPIQKVLQNVFARVRFANRETARVRTSVRKQIRKVREAIGEGDAAKSETEFQLATKKLDRAATKKIIHPNTAARTKSRLSGRHQGDQSWVRQAFRRRVLPA